MKKRDWLLRLTLCLAVGGLGMAGIMCLFVGFGFSTVIGKEAVFLYWLLQCANVIVMRIRESSLLRSAQAPAPSKRMRILRLSTAWLWRLGSITLLASMVFALCGMLLSSLLVVLTCWIGFFATLIGWLGRLMTFHRVRQSSMALAMEKERIQK